VVFEAFDRERLRIEGALHDGVQQDLVGASVALQLALQALDTDPAAARALLEELEREVVQALERVRALPHDIYPPLELDAGPAARYPLELEAAVYLAGRALRPGATRLRIRESDGALRIEATGAFGEAALEEARGCIAAVGGQLAVSAGGDEVTASVSVSSSAR